MKYEILKTGGYYSDRARVMANDVHDYRASVSRDEQAQPDDQLNAEALDDEVNPAIGPIRRSEIKLEPHRTQWIATLGCPIDIELCYDNTHSMGSHLERVQREANKLFAWEIDDLLYKTSAVLPQYAPLFCFDTFGDCGDQFVLYRAHFAKSKSELINYARKIVPKHLGGLDNHGEDPQYAMFARTYLTDTYANRIGLKGYHFIVTDEPYHDHLCRQELERIFGDDIFENELKEMRDHIPSLEEMVKTLKEKTHQFVLVLRDHRYYDTAEKWYNLCGKQSVIIIDSITDLPRIIACIIGLTEGTVDVAKLGDALTYVSGKVALIKQLSKIDIGAQLRLRHALPHPIPKAGDIFASKDDLWPIQAEGASEKDAPTVPSHIEYR